MIEREESLICEALVREISMAQRWSAIKEAWDALLHVRLMAKRLKDEVQDNKSLHPEQASGGLGQASSMGLVGQFCPHCNKPLPVG